MSHTTGTPTPAQEAKGGSLDEVVTWLLELVRDKKVSGTLEVVVSPPPGRFVTSLGLKEAIIEAAAKVTPTPPDTEGLDVQLKGWRPAGVLFVVEGLH